jgi:ArsR family transcriptional regulator
MNKQNAGRVAELFRALGEPLRIRILALLIEGERNVSSIAESLQVNPSSVSHHLRGLRLMRLVDVRRDGKRMIYSLNGEHLIAILKHALDWIG